MYPKRPPECHKDGRRWNKNYPSNWAGHKRVWYVDCKGSYRLTNNNCAYKVHYGVINNTQLEKKNNACKAYGNPGQYVACSAQRFICYRKNRVEVYHCGDHTCHVAMKTNKNLDKIKELIKSKLKIKPSEVLSSIVLAAFR